MNFKKFCLDKIPLNGHNLIEASAGTGKTYTISRLFLRLLLEKQLPLSSILVVTFTEAATTELRERVYLLLKEALNVFTKGFSSDPFFSSLLQSSDNKKALEQLQSAIHNFDTVSIYTIHGFCQRLLFEHSFESGIAFNSEVISDQSFIVDEITNDFWRLNFYTSSEHFSSYILNISLTQNDFKGLLRFSGRLPAKLSIIPQINETNLESQESLFDQKLKSVINIWLDKKPQIVKLLYSKSLKANKYKAETIRQMISEMDLLSSSAGTASPVLFDRFENFTSSVLRSSTKKGAEPPEHEFFDYCEELYTCAQNLKLHYDERVIFLKIKYIKYVNSELKKRKELKSQLYFDDLLLKVYDAVILPENDKAVVNKTSLTNVISKTYKAALIDEFQDTDSIQYHIFSSLFSNSIMFLIGDPKQSIYSFRGADIFTYLEASGNVTSRYSLDTNYRCQKGLLDATNALFGLHENMFVFDGISFSESKAAQANNCDFNPKPFQFLFFDTEEKKMALQEIREHICSVVASEISALLNRDNGSGCKFQPQDIAVLVRKNSEAEIIKDTLTGAGIHSVIDSGNSVFGTPEAVEFLRLLNAIHDPSSYEACFCALTTDFFGYNGNEIYALNNDSKELEQVTELFFKLHDLWTESGFEVMIRYFFNKQKIRSKVLALQSGERKLTNYLHLSELVHVEEVQRSLAIPDILSWITEKIHGDLSHVPDEEVVRLESDENAVKIVTIHKSKGLEYKVVFCPFCWHRSDIKGRKSEPIVFHNEKNETVLALSSSEIENNKNLAEKEILAENMRLLYVALTRAKSECYVVFGKFPGSETSPLSYLLFGDNLEPSFMVQSLKGKVKALSESEIFDQIKSLEHKCSSICVKKVSANSIGNFQNAISRETAIPKQLECRQFSGTIPSTWRISSFSSLSRSHHDSELPDYDYNDSPQEPQNEAINFNSIMDFPKGALAGTFLHHVFEHVQFSSLSDAGSIITEALSMYGFDPKWFDTILKLVQDVTTAVLNNDLGLKLSDVAPENCIKEVQFDFPIKQFSVNELDTAITSDSQPDLFGSEYSVSGLDFFTVRGYMKGFIDLVFKSNGKFFILDWKSNHLGSSTDNYTPEKLFEVMKREHYILQSYIYLTALNKFLKLRFPQYDYDTHFGGIYYLFLRGIAPGSQTGIYFSHPTKALSERLEKVLCQPQKQKADN